MSVYAKLGKDNPGKSTLGQVSSG